MREPARRYRSVSIPCRDAPPLVVAIALVRYLSERCGAQVEDVDLAAVGEGTFTVRVEVGRLMDLVGSS